MVGGDDERVSELPHPRPHTVNILGLIQVDAQDAAVGEGEDKNIVGDLCGDEIGGNRELELDMLNHEHGQRAVVEPSV